MNQVEIDECATYGPARLQNFALYALLPYIAVALMMVNVAHDDDDDDNDDSDDDYDHDDIDGAPYAPNLFRRQADATSTDDQGIERCPTQEIAQPFPSPLPVHKSFYKYLLPSVWTCGLDSRQAGHQDR